MADPGGLEVTLNRASGFILRQSTVLSVLVCFTAGSFLLWKMSQLSNEISSITDLPILDARYSYTPAEVPELFEELGKKGRDLYSQINLLDSAFPFVLSALLAFVIGPVFHRARLQHQWNLFPVIYLVLDLAEGACVRYLLTTYPTPAPTVFFAVTVLTQYKWRFFFYSLAVFGFGLLAITRKMIFPARQPPAEHRD